MAGVSLYLDEELLEKLKAESRKTGRSVSAIVRDAIREYLSSRAREKAKSEFLKILKEANLGSWEEVEKEREGFDAGRS